MRMTYRALLFAVQLTTLCLCQAQAVQAGNASSISDAPIGKFTEEDMKLMNANLDATVADEKVRAVHSWSNPATKHSGTAETLLAFTGPNGIPCKRVSVANRAGNLTGKGQYTLCKMDDRGWSFVSSDYAPVPSAKATGK